MGSVIGVIFALVFIFGGFGAFVVLSRKRKLTDKAIAEGRKPVETTIGSGRSAYTEREPKLSEGAIKRLQLSSAIYNGTRWIGLGVAIIALISLIFSSTTTVSAKNVGVAVNFGKVSQQTLSPGLHFKAPWTKVIEIDGTIQTDQYAGDSCIRVTIGDGSQACAKITNRWQINPKNAASIYEQHRSDDPTQSFRAATISTELEQAISETLGNYNPISNLKVVGGSDDATQVSFVPDYDKLSEQIEDNMKKRLDDADQAKIVGITFSHLDLSDNTQKKINDYIAAVGETRIALQQKETAAAQAAANKELSASVSNDPNVLVSRCLDILKDSSQNGYKLPAGFSCWPGDNGTVVVPKG